MAQFNISTICASMHISLFRNQNNECTCWYKAPNGYIKKHEAKYASGLYNKTSVSLNGVSRQQHGHYLDAIRNSWS